MDEARPRQGHRRELLADLLGSVEGAMTKTVVSVSSAMSASDALAFLYRNGVGGAPVIEHERVVRSSRSRTSRALTPTRTRPGRSSAPTREGRSGGSPT